jgi:hypothetical protein
LSGTPFELYIYNTIRKRYPAYEGWEINEQCPLLDGSKADFYVVQRNLNGKVVDGILIDAKDKAELRMTDIDQMIHYIAECRAERGIIYIANDTLVSSTVQERADQADVEIRRTQW